MSYLNGYTIKLRLWDDEEDVTQYVQSFSTETVAGLGQLGHATCAVTINNQSGEFTPLDVGGQGTYNFSFVGYVLTIEAEIEQSPTPITVTVFDGVVKDVAMSGNTFDSTLTFNCVDWVSLASGEPATTTTNGVEYDYDDGIELVMNGSVPNTGGKGLAMPWFGATSPSQTFQAIPMGPVTTKIELPATTNTTAHDLLANTLMPSGPFVSWPGEITFSTSPAGIQFDLFTLDRNLTRTYDVQSFQFGPNVTGDGIPIVELIVGFTTDLITSTTTTTSGLSGSTAQTVANSTTATTYGGRSRTYTGTANPSDAEALNVSGFWTNRQSFARVTPVEVITTIAAIDADGTASPVEVAALFDYGDSLFQVANTSFTATGGTAITTSQVTTSRRISATPGSTTISVRMLPSADYTSFVLNSSTLGKLNLNRLG